MPSKVVDGRGNAPTPRLYEAQFNDLHSNCLEGTVEEILNFFKNGNKLKQYDSGLTPLHVVVLSRRKDAPEVIDILLEHGVDINATTTEEEKTALHLVAEHGEFPHSFTVVVKLLDCDADTTLRDRKLRTAYDLALARDNVILAAALDGTMDTQELKEFYYKRMSEIYGPYLIQAVIESDEDSIKRNIDFHADPNTLNTHGAGAIHYAITHCNLPAMKTLQMLVDAGSDVNLKDHENDTALNLAIKSDKLRKDGSMGNVVSSLIKWGADPTIKDLDGRDAYDLANKRGYNDIIPLLKKAGHKKREDSFVAQTPIPETPRRTPIEHPSTRATNRSPNKSPQKPPIKPKEKPVTPAPISNKEQEEDSDDRKDKNNKNKEKDEDRPSEGEQEKEDDVKKDEEKDKSKKKESKSCVIL